VSTQQNEITAGSFDIQIFPNPMTYFLNIKSHEKVSIMDAFLFDLLGREQDIDLQYLSNQQLRMKPATTLPTGIYLLYLSTDRGIISRKLMVK
ncbi:MAG: T9SS type A sorting domain-containing protein, partial [Bacteroidota bacterium]